MAEFVPSEVWCDRLAQQNGFWVIAEEKPYVAGQCSGSDWWVFLPPDQYASLVAAYQSSLAGGSSSGSTVQPSFPLASLTLEQAEQLGWMSLAPIVAAYLARKFRDVLN